MAGGQNGGQRNVLYVKEQAAGRPVAPECGQPACSARLLTSVIVRLPPLLTHEPHSASRDICQSAFAATAPLLRLRCC
jgi:hypothetical protein